MAKGEEGRYRVTASDNGVYLIDTEQGAVWRLYGDKWKYIPFSDKRPSANPELWLVDIENPAGSTNSH